MGGSLASAPTALQAGTYSQEPFFSDGLVLSYSFSNGDVSDSMSGEDLLSFTSANFHLLWAPTNFEGRVGDVSSQCIEVPQ